MKSGETAAQANRRIRQEALRDQLAEQCRVQHVLVSIEKLEDLDSELAMVEVQRIKGAIDSRLKLINKYLPDQKEVFSEVTGNLGITHDQWIESLSD